MTDSKKIYTVIFPECNTLIQSTTPSGAAKKAYSKCIRPFLKESEREKESRIVKLQSEAGKMFEYEVKEISKQDFVTRGDKKIPYTYNVLVKSKNIHKSPEQKYKKKRTPSLSPPRSISKEKEISKTKKLLSWCKKINRSPKRSPKRNAL